MKAAVLCLKLDSRSWGMKLHLLSFILLLVIVPKLSPMNTSILEYVLKTIEFYLLFIYYLLTVSFTSIKLLLFINYFYLLIIEV